MYVPSAAVTVGINVTVTFERDRARRGRVCRILVEGRSTDTASAQAKILSREEIAFSFRVYEWTEPGSDDGTFVWLERRRLGEIRITLGFVKWYFGFRCAILN